MSAVSSRLSDRLEGKVAVVTGAGGAIGRACAIRLAREGARVAVADVRLDAAERTATMIDAVGAEAVAIQCDVTREEEVVAMADQCVARFGAIDLLQNNSGVLIPGSVLTQRLSDWDLHYAVNVRGVLLVSRAIIPHMLRQGGGVIVNTASTAGLVGEPNCAAYDSTKGAVVSLTRQMAVDFGPQNVRVNCVCPGWIDTGFNDPIFEEAGMDDAAIAELIDQTVPLKRQGAAEEVAPAVAFLFSDDASYVTGHALVIDGGMVAQ